MVESLMVIFLSRNEWLGVVLGFALAIGLRVETIVAFDAEMATDVHGYLVIGHDVLLQVLQVGQRDLLDKI